MVIILIIGIYYEYVCIWNYIFYNSNKKRKKENLGTLP